MPAFVRARLYRLLHSCSRSLDRLHIGRTVTGGGSLRDDDRAAAFRDASFGKAACAVVICCVLGTGGALSVIRALVGRDIGDLLDEIRSANDCRDSAAMDSDRIGCARHLTWHIGSGMVAMSAPRSWAASERQGPRSKVSVNTAV